MVEPDPRSDDELVEAADLGDTAAFEELYYRYRDWVVRLARRFAGNREDALDVLQETFAYLLRKLPDLHLSARMTSFLYPVVKHLSIAARTKRQRYVTDDALLRQQAARPMDGTKALRADLADALAVLPEGQLEVVLMRFVDSMALQEIADALDIPLGTVKSRLHKALATLRTDARTRRYFGRQEKQ